MPIRALSLTFLALVLMGPPQAQAGLVDPVLDCYNHLEELFKYVPNNRGPLVGSANFQQIPAVPRDGGNEKGNLLFTFPKGNPPVAFIFPGFKTQSQMCSFKYEPGKDTCYRLPDFRDKKGYRTIYGDIDGFKATTNHGVKWESEQNGFVITKSRGYFDALDRKVPSSACLRLDPTLSSDSSEARKLDCSLTTHTLTLIQADIKEKLIQLAQGLRDDPKSLKKLVAVADSCVSPAPTDADKNLHELMRKGVQGALTEWKTLTHPFSGKLIFEPALKSSIDEAIAHAAK